jgi:Skp family chaperone for outer membrane proteins
MKALLFVSLLTFAIATAASAQPAATAQPRSSYQYPHYPKWAAQAFETHH